MVKNLAGYRVPTQAIAQDLALQFARQAAGLRGYVATGKDNFYEEYKNAKEQADQDLEYLKSYATAESKAKLDPVISATIKYSLHPTNVVSLYQAQGQAQAREYMAEFESVDNSAAQAAIADYISFENSRLQSEAGQAPTMVKRILTLA